MSKQAQVCWLSGSIHERKAVLKKLLKQFEGCDVQRLDGDVSYAYFEQQILTASCFSDRRMVIVSDLPTPSGTKPTMVNHIKKLLTALPEDILLVFDGVDDCKPLTDVISKVGKVFDFPVTLNRNEAVAWIVKRFSELGKNIEQAEALALIDTCGYDQSVKGLGADQLRIFVHKIATYIGNRRKAVTMDDIVINAVNTEEFVQWRIFDAIDARNFEQCEEQFAKFVENEGNMQRAVDKLYSMSIPRYRLLFFLKEGLAKKIPKDALAREAMALQKSAKNEKTGEEERVPAYSEFAINGALYGAYGRDPTVELYTRKSLARIMDCLLEGMSEVRTRGNDPSVLILADVLFLAACSTTDDTILSNLRKMDE